MTLLFVLLWLNHCTCEVHVRIASFELSCRRRDVPPGIESGRICSVQRDLVWYVYDGICIINVKYIEC